MAFSLNINAQNQCDSFPGKWEGKWCGVLHMSQPFTSDTIYMCLEIGPAVDSSRVNYTITYIMGERVDKREYMIVKNDSDCVRMTLDEQNSIAMEDFFFGDALNSIFEVNGTILVSTITHLGDSLRNQIVTYRPENRTESGGEGDIPVVYSYPVSSVQYAMLSKDFEEPAPKAKAKDPVEEK